MMEQTVTIDGREVTFKSDGATPLRYRAEFRRDFFGDILKMQPIMSALTGQDSITNDTHIDMSLIENIIFILAKTADKEIGDIFEWYSSFSAFPVFEVFMELQDLIYSNMQTVVKKAKKK